MIRDKLVDQPYVEIKTVSIPVDDLFTGKVSYMYLHFTQKVTFSEVVTFVQKLLKAASPEYTHWEDALISLNNVENPNDHSTQFKTHTQKGDVGYINIFSSYLYKN